MLASPPQKNMEDTLTEEGVYVEQAAFMAAGEEQMKLKTSENGDPASNRAIGQAASSREGPVVLQWGERKRPRCSRDTHVKHSTITGEPSVLLRTTLRVKAEKVLTVKNRVEEHPQLPPPKAQVVVGVEEGRKMVKICRGGASDLVKVSKETPSKRNKVAYSHASSHNTLRHKPHALYSGKNRTSPDRSTSSPCRTVVNGGGIEFAEAKVEVEWPKFFVSLSRKEKEDDFFIIKGNKLPQRPKRRPKVVERALHFCTPGSWLTDLSRGRYDVREKKCVKKKPRGLKAMGSVDSDSE